MASGVWSVGPWREAGFLKNLVLLELFPVIVAIEIWSEAFLNKRFGFTEITWVLSKLSICFLSHFLFMCYFHVFIFRCCLPCLDFGPLLRLLGLGGLISGLMAISWAYLCLRIMSGW